MGWELYKNIRQSRQIPGVVHCLSVYKFRLLEANMAILHSLDKIYDIHVLWDIITHLN